MAGERTLRDMPLISKFLIDEIGKLSMSMIEAQIELTANQRRHLQLRLRRRARHLRATTKKGTKTAATAQNPTDKLHPYAMERI